MIWLEMLSEFLKLTQYWHPLNSRLMLYPRMMLPFRKLNDLVKMTETLAEKASLSLGIGAMSPFCLHLYTSLKEVIYYPS